MRDTLTTVRTRRAQLASIVAGQKIRSAQAQASIAAIVAAAGLAAIDAATFGFLDGCAATDSVSITAGDRTLTSPDNPWTAADVGKTIHIAGAGAAGAVLVSTVASYTSTGEIDISDDAVTGVAATKTSAGGLAAWGWPYDVATDDPATDANGNTVESIRLPGPLPLSERLLALANLRDDPSVPAGIIPNNGAVSNRNISILGDSIAHGAYALNSFMHAWPRIFARCINAERGLSSYGFVNLLSLGAGPTLTEDLHSVAFGGAAWGGVDAATIGSEYPAGAALRSSGATSTITITVPYFQAYAEFFYGKQVGGGSFTVKINGVLSATQDTAGAAGWASVKVGMTDNGYGNCIILIECASADPVDIIGVGYVSGATDPVVNNFSNSGRRLAYASQACLDSVMQQSSVLVMALGHNDQGTADVDDAYYAEFMLRIGWLTTYANTYGVRVVVPDCCWTAPATSRTRIALRKLATDTGGLYVDLPGQLFRPGMVPSDDYLIDTLEAWVDGSHPNKYGHAWIAETIAKRMGLAVCSKWTAIRRHDWWMPIALKVASGAYNTFATDYKSVSQYRRDGSQIVIKAYVQTHPSNAFPTGAKVISDGWRAISELVAVQSILKVAMPRADTGAAVSVIAASSSGALTLTVNQAWTADQDFVVTAPLDGGTL